MGFTPQIHRFHVEEHFGNEAALELSLQLLYVVQINQLFPSFQPFHLSMKLA